MTPSSLKFDGSFLPSGVPLRLNDRLRRARSHLLTLRDRHEQGWLQVPSDRTLTSRIQSMVAETSKFDTLLVLGIGGSDLGARAILQALPQQKRVMFAGANTDPDEWTMIEKTVNWKKTLVNIISKSGDTIEPMSAFLLARECLKKAVGKAFAKQIIATTDPANGTLHAWAELEGYRQLIVPSNIGGRYSVLSDVGLFPAAWAGVPVDGLLKGATDEQHAFESLEPHESVAGQYAAWHAEAFTQGRNLFVLMPYVARLDSFAHWYRQLVAESLGKAFDRTGHKSVAGPTPIAALGATDQHSQLQLYMDGPEDKIVTFIELEQFDQPVRIPALPASAPALDALPGHSLEELIHAERRATAEALAGRNRPNGTLVLSRLDAVGLGHLFQMFMLANALLAELFDVNAYDQPGVEDGKKRFHAWLNAAPLDKAI